MKPVLVVPCYNEEKRFSVSEWAKVAETMHLVCVDDGSTDGTRRMLERFAASSDGNISVLCLSRNGGKAEAVRHGLLFAAELGASIVGFADADLATPGYELVRLATTLASSTATAVIGSRRAATVERNAVRGVMGRIFAGVASMVLGSHFDDTQCGAKFFRTTRLFREALSMPFSSRWSFDVELLGRLLTGREDGRTTRSQICEVELTEWTDVAGSKLKMSAAIRSGFELLAVPAHVETWRASESSMKAATADEAAPVSGVYRRVDATSFVVDEVSDAA